MTINADEFIKSVETKSKHVFHSSSFSLHQKQIQTNSNYSSTSITEQVLCSVIKVNYLDNWTYLDNRTEKCSVIKVYLNNRTSKRSVIEMPKTHFR